MNSDCKLITAVDVLLHIFPLFIFLTLFFFLYLHTVSEKQIDDIINQYSTQPINYFLDELDTLDEQKHIGINWSDIKQEGINVQNPDLELDQRIKEHNKSLLHVSIGMIIFLFILLVFIISYLKAKNCNIGLSYLVFENFIVLVIVGIIELLLFKYIINKYVPVYPSDLIDNALDRTKQDILNKF